MRTYTVTEYDKEDYTNYRDNLDVKGVIQGLRYIARGYLPDYDYSGDENDFNNYTNHVIISKAIEFLEEKA